MKKTKCIYLLLVLAVLCSTANADTYVKQDQNAQIVSYKTADLLSYADHSEETLYYAYLDYASASALDKERILNARREIIFHESWSAEDTNLYLCDVEGNVIETYPKFYDIFPDEWEMPNFNEHFG